MSSQFIAEFSGIVVPDIARHNRTALLYIEVPVYLDARNVPHASQNIHIHFAHSDSIHPDTFNVGNRRIEPRNPVSAKCPSRAVGISVG